MLAGTFKCRRCLLLLTIFFNAIFPWLKYAMQCFPALPLLFLSVLAFVLVFLCRIWVRHSQITFGNLMPLVEQLKTLFSKTWRVAPLTPYPCCPSSWYLSWQAVRIEFMVLKCLLKFSDCKRIRVQSVCAGLAKTLFSLMLCRNKVHIDGKSQLWVITISFAGRLVVPINQSVTVIIYLNMLKFE